jgi:hypothetical protein
VNTLVIDDPHGFDTVFSTDPSSPAAPFLQEYRPRSIADLYDIGVIPKYLPLTALQSAKDAGLAVGARPVQIDNLSVRNLPAAEQRHYLEAQTSSRRREGAVLITSRMLMAQHGLESAEADLLARKLHSFHDAVNAVASWVFVAVQLPENLVVRTRLIIDPSVHSITANDVLVHKGGEIRALGRYFLVRCTSWRGEGFWWQSLVTNQVTDVARIRRQ